MQRPRLLPWFFSAALIVGVACSDSVAPNSDRAAAPAPPPPPALLTLTGSVHVTNEDLYRVVLTTSDGQNIRLSGESANQLVSVDNADVEVRGQWEPDSIGFFVADFLVRAVNGNEVVDGVLVSLSPILTDGADSVTYAIRPTRGGSFIVLPDPSADLLIHLNERIWIAGLGGSGGAPMQFGVISEM